MPSIGIPTGATGTAEFTYFAIDRSIAGVREPFYGRGIDGNVVLGGAGANINGSILGTASGGRSVDAPKTAVTAFSSAQVTVTSSTNFRAGDYCLLINLQGSSTRYAQVGIYELVKISTVDDATHITFTGVPTKLYGQNGSLTPVNSDLTGQKVVLQRIPEYGKISSSDPNNGSIVASAWDGTTGGVVAFMCHELNNLPGFNNGFAPFTSTYGVIVTGAGYRGGTGGNPFTMDAYGEGTQGANGANPTGTGGTGLIVFSPTTSVNGNNAADSPTPSATIGGGGGSAGWGAGGSGGNRLAGPAGSSGGRGGGGGAGGGNAGQPGGSGSAGGSGPGAGAAGNSSVSPGMAGGGTTGGPAVLDGSAGKLFLGGGGGGVVGDLNQYGNGGRGGITPNSNAGTSGGSGGLWGTGSPVSYEKASGRAGGGIILIWAKTVTYSNKINANGGGNNTTGSPTMPWPVAIGTVVNPTQSPGQSNGSGPGARGGSAGSGRSGTAGGGAGGAVILITNSLTTALPTIEIESPAVEGGPGQTGLAGSNGGGAGGNGEAVAAIPSISSGYGLIRYIGNATSYASSSPDGTGNYAPSTQVYKASL